MSPSALSALLAVAILSRSALAQPDPADPTPLVDKTYAYPNGIPYQVDYNTAAIRGPQTGYNICNSTTQNQLSQCQTAFVNHIDDFCLWAPPEPNSTIGDTEQLEVAWCTKGDHGTRLIPAGALTGVQVLRTSAYIQLAGFIDQTQINMAVGDYGGELDPHGADLRGNPLGGLMYSNVFPSNGGNNNSYQQVINWSNFMGGNQFCMTICDPATAQSDQDAYCQNIYDRIGCSYNMPNNAQNNVFEVCDSDLKTPVGIYVTNGATMTYTQPPEGVTPSPPYTPVIPASSNCVTYQSAALYTSLPAPTATPSTSATTGAPGSGATSKPSSGSGSSAAPAPTKAGNGAAALGTSSIAGVLCTLFAVAFLA